MTEPLDSNIQEQRDFIVEALDEFKAFDIAVFDVRGKTSITDIIIIASGTSDRHTKAMANHLIQEGKQNGFTILGVEGEDKGEWILIDFGDVVTHLMLPPTRVFYQLEKLWSVDNQISPDGEAMIKKAGH